MTKRYRTRISAAHNEADEPETCGVCRTEHNLLSFTIVTTTVFGYRPIGINKFTDVFVCSRTCLMAHLTTNLITQEANGVAGVGL